MKKIVHKIRRRKTEDSLGNRITNDTVAAHREQVLGRARKYIYPLQHSKHKLVKISVALFLIALVAFFTYCTLALYRFKTENNFIYKVTQVIPFPIARVGSDFVAYENYLFEVNRYAHFYKTQQAAEFDDDAYQEQIAQFRQRALDKVVNELYIKKLAQQNGVSVSDREVEDKIAQIRSQNRLGGGDQEYESVLKDFWNWTPADFKRSLKSQILEEKVSQKLNTETRSRAEAGLSRIKAGQDFATVAREISEEPNSKANGGDYGFAISTTDPNINPNTVEALFKLKDGETSEVINVGYGLEIVKRISTQPDGKVKAAHIVFNFKDINDFINPLKDSEKARVYVRL
jgi:parvulin-like peptidyl-prolyl isomerase